MSRPHETPSPRSALDADAAVGLRFRVWLACLAGGLVAAGGIWLVAGFALTAEGPEGWRLLAWLLVVSSAAILVAGGFALWLDRGVVGHLRGLLHGLSSGRVADLRGIPGGAGWGELAELTDLVQAMIARQERARRAESQQAMLDRRLVGLRAALERAAEGGPWEPPTGGGDAGELVRLVTLTLERDHEMMAEVLSAVDRAREDLALAATDARETAEQSERGFVEATALLTTARELQRLGADLQAAIEAAAAPRGSEAVEAYRAATAEAISDLVTASVESVERLAGGLARVQEITEQVPRLANRATLIALHAVVAGGREGTPGGPVPESQTDELKLLAVEVREASGRTLELGREIEREVAAASARMREVRESVTERLDRVPAPPPPVAPETVARLLGRVREMIQDAARKGEGLSAAGERASRAAERLVRRLEDDVRELENMVNAPESPVSGDEAGAPPPAGGEDADGDEDEDLRGGPPGKELRS